MVGDIYEALIDLGYSTIDEISLKEAILGGPKSIHFTKIVEWVSKELQVLYKLDEHVNAITSSDDSSSFLMELSSFLKELGCQYSQLMAGSVNERLRTEFNKMLVLDYLLTELKSARMIHANKPDTTLKVNLNESSTAVDLKSMLLVLKLPKPPTNISPKILFDKVAAKLKEYISKSSVSLYGLPLFVGMLSDKQWHILDSFYKELYTEYRIRREMLIKRLDVTIQSFEWSDRLKSKSNEIQNSFQQLRQLLTVDPTVRLSDVLATRKDLAILEKTSSASVRRKTKTALNDVLIGLVPDRGGRPYEQEPPPPEMPSWQQRSSGGSSAGGGGGRGRGRNEFNSKTASNFEQNRNTGGPPRGGRVQAGWSAPQSNFQPAFESGGNYSKQGGIQDQRTRSPYQYGGNVQSYSGPSDRGGYYRGRGGHQNYGSNEDYRRNEGTRNHYNRW